MPMSVEGPIIIIEDDNDDQNIYKEIFVDLGIKNELKIFDTALQVLSYLKTTTDKPFLIISDVNLPGLSGTDLKRIINDDEFLRKKSIPFIFYSTSAQKEAIDKAYDTMIQGFFTKENSVPEIKSTIKAIMNYWKLCKHPT